MKTYEKVICHDQNLRNYFLYGHGLYIDCFPDPNRDPIWNGMILNKPKVEKGWIQVPQGFGFDIKLDWDKVNKYRIN